MMLVYLRKSIQYPLAGSLEKRTRALEHITKIKTISLNALHYKNIYIKYVGSNLLWQKKEKNK